MIRDTLITPEQAADIRARVDVYNAWSEQFRQPNGWTVIPAGTIPPVELSNDERGELERFEIYRDPPERLFCYVWIGEGGCPEVRAKVWTGELIGYGSAGREYRGNMGDKRRPVAVIIAGYHYSGTAFVSAGDYARLKRGKRANAPWIVRYVRDCGQRAYEVQTAGRVSYVVSNPDSADFGKRCELRPGFMATSREIGSHPLPNGRDAKAAKKEAQAVADEYNARKRPDGSFVYTLEPDH